MIHVLAIVTAKPGQRERILQAFREIVDAVRAEAGCIDYDVVVDHPQSSSGRARFGDDTFVVVEKWASLEALQAHSESGHLKAYAIKVKDLTAHRAVHVLQPL